MGDQKFEEAGNSYSRSKVVETWDDFEQAETPKRGSRGGRQEKAEVYE